MHAENLADYCELLFIGVGPKLMRSCKTFLDGVSAVNQQMASDATVDLEIEASCRCFVQRRVSQAATKRIAMLQAQIGALTGVTASPEGGVPGVPLLRDQFLLRRPPTSTWCCWYVCARMPADWCFDRRCPTNPARG